MPLDGRFHTALLIPALIVFGTASHIEKAFAQEACDPERRIESEGGGPRAPDRPSYENEMQIHLEFGYRGVSISNANNLSTAPIAVVTRVEILYTVCAHQRGFDQTALNARRIAELRKTDRDLFSNPLTIWSNVENHACRNRAEGEKLFHGFVVHYRPKPDAALARREADYVKSGLSRTPSTKEVPPKSTERKDVTPEKYSCGGGHVPLKDDVVEKVFQRNAQWIDTLIVADLTGSMSPYALQLLVWFKLVALEKRVKSFMFFNDGDTKPDSSKKAMATGGLYYGQAAGFEAIAALAKKTMQAGSGSDIQENDVEALVAGIQKCPQCKNVILVADNYAPMRDFGYVEKIGKPVRVILCGYFGRANPELLYLAWKTGGSVHTIEEDIENIAALHEGESITIGKRRYALQKGRFVLAKDT